MITIHTHEGKSIEIILQSELCDPVNMGEYVRAYCHIHGSDHQRSLSIKKSTGWGHCFNAACNATVLVGEWNPPRQNTCSTCTIRDYLRHLSVDQPPYQAAERRRTPFAFQPMLLHPPKSIPKWQQDELAALLSLDGQMRIALAHSERALAYMKERGISLEMALTTGVRYLSSAMINRLAKKSSDVF